MQVNFLHVLVAAIVNFVIGGLWHGPLFGKKWMALAGMSPESMKNMKMSPAKAMTLGFVSVLVMTYVLGYFVTGLYYTVGVTGALQLTFWLWLGFIVTTLAGGVLWEGKSAKLFVFNIVYQFVSLFATTLVLVLWQ